MSDLVAFLRARLDEDEAAARAAGSPRDGVPTEPKWCVDSEAWDAPLPAGVGVVTETPEGDGDGVAIVHGDRRARHIARWDPARVLAEVAAKRWVMRDHEPFTASYIRAVPQCLACASMCHSRSGLGCDDPCDAVWPCDLMVGLVQPYAGHPDFDPAWATEGSVRP